MTEKQYSTLIITTFYVQPLCKFGRAKLKDLVNLLGGRDFETREYKALIAEESFAKLSEGVIDFMKQYTFANFILGIKGAGFISNKLINSQITLDFAT